MIPATLPVQRPPNARLLVVGPGGAIRHLARSEFTKLLRRGDLVIANDAATLPASLTGEHLRTGRMIEARLAGRPSLAVDEVSRFSAVIFGEGDFRMRTEDRPEPPELVAGDRLVLGPLQATVEVTLGHPRLVALHFDGTAAEIWRGLAHHGRPIQYSYLSSPLAIWDSWTSIAGPPVAFEPPSAGFALDWRTIASMRECGVRFETITHAAGISSTGDPHLDALLPFDEPYRIKSSTARAIQITRRSTGRVIAVGTTVVRALEHSASYDGSVRAGEGLATQRIGPATQLRVVDAVLSGTHERGESHHDLLRAFLDDRTISRMDEALEGLEYRTHEYGDSVFIENLNGLLRASVA